MTDSSAGRWGMSITIPLLSLLLYWGRLHGNYSTDQLLLASAIAIAVAAGLYLYAPVARKVERWSTAWILLWIVVIAVGVTGFIYDTHPWGFPVAFIAIWAPVHHSICRLNVGESKAGNSMSPQTG